MRVLFLAAGAAILFSALALVNTGDDPYAPNDWLFSHVALANIAIDSQRIPLNTELFLEHRFERTTPDFKAETGLKRMTFYANTMWHFWNGLPLHPALLASLSALTGIAPEDASRLPIGGIAILLLVYASADLLLRDRASHLAPFAFAIASAPLVLDLRTLMPSTSLVIVALLFHLLLRRTLANDRWALAFSMVPIVLLPFWYYTVSYFVIFLFGGFLVANLAMRAFRADAPPVAPLAFALLVPIALVGVLVVNGALTSHVNMATQLGGIPLLGTEAGSDYEEHLNRVGWRSALLYVELGALFAPLVLASLIAAWRVVRRRAVDAPSAVFAQWAVGGAAFSLAIQGAVGVSFLNRTAIYLTPIAAVAIAWALARHRWGRPAAIAAIGVGLLATPILVATASPTYSAGDAEAFAWTQNHVPQTAVIYGSLDASSVLFREHGFTEALAFHPRTRLLEDFWYGHDANAMVPYLASVEWFVLRDDARTMGFEEFGPLRKPIDAEAYAKFGASPDLHRVYDNGEVEVYKVALAPSRLRAM